MDPLVAQSELNGEDSSGSDGASVFSVSIPPTETDRFGFLLGTESTVGSEGPPPELVRQREAKWLNIIMQWDRILLKRTNKVKEQCRKGIPASLKARCWPLLCRATERMKANEKLYKKLDTAPALQTWVDVIERDIDRQFPFHEMFLSRDGHGQQGLFRVLKAYTQYKPEEGYCQGQGPVAAVLLMNMPAEEAFWCLVQISEQYLPGYYSPLLEGVLFDAGILNGVLRKVCPAAHKHLKKHEVEPLMFATDWLMCLYTRHLPFNTLLRVWDLFFCYGVRILFQVAVVLVHRSLGKQEQRDECDGQMETLERLRSVKDRISMEADAFIVEVCSVPFSRKDLERETEKEMERWKKEHPSSTFNPCLRCHGYRAAWVKGREKEEECQRREREIGNLSVPVSRSPSSLSPSFLRKKWRRGSKAEMSEKEGNGGREENKLKEVVELKGKEEKEAINNDGNRRKPSEYSSEDATLNQKGAGQESTQAAADSSCQNLELCSGAADLSHSQNTCSLSKMLNSCGGASTDCASEAQDSTNTPTAQIETPENQTENNAVADHMSQLVSVQTGSVFSETVNCSADQGEPQKPLCDKADETAEVTRKLSQESCQSEPSEAGKLISPNSCPESDAKGASKLNKNTEEKPEETNVQNTGELDVGTEECIKTQDDCRQSFVKETSTLLEDSSANSPDLNETQQENDQPVQYSLHPSEDINENVTKTPEMTGEPSTAENTEKVDSLDIPAHHCQIFHVLQESEISSISSVDESELSVQKHANEEASSEDSPQNDPLASRTIMTAISDQPACDGVTEKQPATSASESDEEHSDDVTQIEPPSEQDNDQIPVRSSVDTNLQENLQGTGQSLGEHPGQSSEVDIISSKGQDLTEKSPCSTHETMLQVSGSEITTAIQEEQKPLNSQDADAPQVESRPPEGSVIAVPSAEGNAIEYEQQNLSAADIREEAPQQPSLTSSGAVQQPADPLCAAEDEVRGGSLDTCGTKMETPERTPPELHLATEMEKPAESQNDQGCTAEQSAECHIEQIELEAEVGSKDQCKETMEADREENGQNNNRQDDETNSDAGHSSPESKDASCEETNSSTPPSTQTSQGQPPGTSTDSVMTEALPEVTAEHGKDEAIKVSATLENQKSSGTGEYKLRKTSSSRTTPPRRLSEDTFKEPESTRYNSGPSTASSTSSSAANHTGGTRATTAVQDTDKSHDTEHHSTEHKDSSKRFGLFRRFRGDHVTNVEGGAKGKAKMTVPTILIQDFSEQVSEQEERLTAKERRKRRREEERRKKEEEKARKKREKELEKEKGKERRKPQTRGKSFQVHSSSKTDHVVPSLGNSITPGSKRNSAPYFDTYF
uniref:Ecotropic viral integration site 5 ortholog-like n=1 Tax=Paramormyrops kingsleyae TaxID=1676925 RepID=A0A3B3Q435_9TELE|nr:ecotropic viral integration site 5 ortholog-like [Paramormyrops kingsleyae]